MECSGQRRENQQYQGGQDEAGRGEHLLVFALWVLCCFNLTCENRNLFTNEQEENNFRSDVPPS